MQFGMEADDQIAADTIDTVGHGNVEELVVSRLRNLVVTGTGRFADIASFGGTLVEGRDRGSLFSHGFGNRRGGLRLNHCCGVIGTQCIPYFVLVGGILDGRNARADNGADTSGDLEGLTHGGYGHDKVRGGEFERPGRLGGILQRRGGVLVCGCTACQEYSSSQKRKQRGKKKARIVEPVQSHFTSSNIMVRLFIARSAAQALDFGAVPLGLHPAHARTQRGAGGVPRPRTPVQRREAAGEFEHGELLVLKLGPRRCGHDHESGGQMADAHRRVGGVLLLAARSGTSEEGKLQFFVGRYSDVVHGRFGSTRRNPFCAGMPILYGERERGGKRLPVRMVFAGRVSRRRGLWRHSGGKLSPTTVGPAWR